MIGFFTFCTQMAFSYLQPGQIGRFVTWGYCGDMKKIAESFEEREPIWINVDSSLFKFFVEEDKKLSFYPNNNIWKLKPWFPKYKKLNNNRKQYVFSFPSEQESFFEKLNEKGIKKVALVVSSSKNQKFKYRKQNWLDIFREFAFLKPLDPVKMKNKVLHVFEVTNLGFD